MGGGRRRELKRCWAVVNQQLAQAHQKLDQLTTSSAWPQIGIASDCFPPVADLGNRRSAANAGLAANSGPASRQRV